MKQCKTCGIISHPHKDFYKCFNHSDFICKYCNPVIRILRKDGRLKTRRRGVEYDTNETLLIRKEIEITLIKDGKRYTKSLKRQILKRLLDNYGKFKCLRCSSFHIKQEQPKYLRKHNTCQQCHIIVNKEWQKINADKFKSSMKKYYENNRSKLNDYSKEYIKSKINNDLFFRFQMSVRSLISSSIRNKGYTKKSRTYEILGCDWETFKLHIEKQFKKGMTWENRSEWHIDHIYPMKEAKTEEDVIRLNHYTNLRPLWAKENLSKNASIEEHQMKLPI